jgi:hypothetical protein
VHPFQLTVDYRSLRLWIIEEEMARGKSIVRVKLNLKLRLPLSNLGFLILKAQQGREEGWFCWNLPSMLM